MGAFFALMPRWGWIALGAVLLMAAFYFTLDAYGDSKYDAGKAKADAEWKEASDKAVAKVAAAGKKADIMEANRLADHNEKVASEKEKIDAAVKEGTDPLDALFPAAE